MTGRDDENCVQVVREHYLRDDIYSGSPLDPESSPSVNKLSLDASHYIVVDTNVALQQVWQLSRAHCLSDCLVARYSLETAC